MSTWVARFVGTLRGRAPTFSILSGFFGGSRQLAGIVQLITGLSSAGLFFHERQKLAPYSDLSILLILRKSSPSSITFKQRKVLAASGAVAPSNVAVRSSNHSYR